MQELKFARPPKPGFFHEKPTRSSFFAPVRRSAKRFIRYTIDHGWFGLTPLETHVVICGFPRSGSTLLQLIVETCVSDLKKFGRERRALDAAQAPFRNQRFMMTKKPSDIFMMDEIRAFYASHKPQVRFVLTIRDPRAVLSSRHAALEEGEFVATPEVWHATYTHFQYARQFDDVAVVKFEELVINPDTVQKRLTDFIGWHVHHPFSEFHTAVPPEWQELKPTASLNLNGLRPLDKNTIEKWKDEKRQEHIRKLLIEMPELPQRLIEMGYEADTSWTRHYVS